MSTQRDERRRLGIFNLSEAAAELRVSSGWLRKNREPHPPSAWQGKRPCYTADDLKRIRETLDKGQFPRRNLRDELEAEGLLTMLGASQHFDIPRITWTLAVQQGRVPRPSHRRGNLWLYLFEEARSVADDFKAHHVPQGCLTGRQVGEQLGLSRSMTQYYLRDMSDLGRSLHKRLKVYLPSEIEEIRRRLTLRKNKKAG